MANDGDTALRARTASGDESAAPATHHDYIERVTPVATGRSWPRTTPRTFPRWAADSALAYAVTDIVHGESKWKISASGSPVAGS